MELSSFDTRRGQDPQSLSSLQLSNNRAAIEEAERARKKEMRNGLYVHVHVHTSTKCLYCPAMTVQ